MDNSTPHTAAGYDVGVANTLPYYSSFHEETIHLVSSLNKNPDAWLDTGCGTGTFVERALSIFPHTIFYLADPSSSMLQQAAQKLHPEDNPRVHVLEPLETGQLSALWNEQFNVVTAIQSHHYLNKSERIKATKRSYELLKNEGIFVIFENTRPRTTEGLTTAKRYWQQFQLQHGVDELTVQKQLSRFDVAYFPITIEEHITLLTETGFRTVELFWHSYMQSGFYAIK